MESEVEVQDAISSICVVIPAYKVSKHILQVITSIGPEVDKIIIIDDACPEGSGELVRCSTSDPRVEVLNHSVNQGVGGAVKSGYMRALAINSKIIVKIDGDGQMDTSRIIELVSPLLNGAAGYTKGNRFFEVEAITKMPKIRILGNIGLSFLTKLSTGYWQIFDPNNGFTAVDATVLRKIPLNKLDSRYFFESDLLFRLNLYGVIVEDIPIPCLYGNEKSNLSIFRTLIEFPIKHLRNFFKRIIYTYYLKDFNLASIELPLGIVFGSFGLILGLTNWITGLQDNQATPTGTLILVSMSIITGNQLILAFFSYDVNKRI